MKAASPLAGLLTGEQKLIDSIKSWVGGNLIGDDCALIASQMLVSTDALVEGVHFRRDLMTLEQIGWKAVAVNLSDIAAMAGRPRYLFVTVCAPAEFSHTDFRSLYQGITDCARQYRVTVAGGDITASEKLMLSLTVIGDVHENGCLTRAGAKPGDVVVATGDFGASRAGLSRLLCGETSRQGHALERHIRPVPRLSESWTLVSKTGSLGALMDASDGFADAILQIARASSVGLMIELGSIPIHEETRKIAAEAGVDPIEWALYGGEDYELVGCIDANVWGEWRKEGSKNNPFVPVGIVTDGDSIAMTRHGAAAPALDMTRCFQHRPVTK
ncbi:MAG: thiamine-phosphate kinase [Cyanobacteria bacterium PR.3.49]|jgi:thiamine-monophosphate kinase|nr:thiamine-phosphate kinase [Cyanobacteria bacterium PR.3.49]